MGSVRAPASSNPVSGSSASRRPSARKRAVRRPAFSQAGESAKGEEFLLVLELFRGLECLYVAPAKTRGSCTAVLGGPDRSRHGSPDFDYKTRRRGEDSCRSSSEHQFVHKDAGWSAYRRRYLAPERLPIGSAIAGLAADDAVRTRRAIRLGISPVCSSETD
jgi:hypothetical protein